MGIWETESIDFLSGKFQVTKLLINSNALSECFEVVE